MLKKYQCLNLLFVMIRGFSLDGTKVVKNGYLKNEVQ